MPPEGVVLDGTGQNHKLQTKYAYNTLGQVVWQQTPDAGESKFWIDYYGRVKLSQNAEQKEHSDYAYSKFDELGRPYEVGKLSSSGNLRLEVEGNNPLTLLEKSELIFDSDFPRAGSVTLLQVNGGTPTFNFTLSERIKTFYDKHDATGIVDPIEQKNLKNRVAAVVVMEEGETVGAVTRYSYDIHGNVEKLWQQLPQETGLPEKTVEYNYDLLSGKVNEVVYEGGKTDEFRHRYLYDGDNRLTQVETSLDGYHWTLEASYFYYAHGPLARIETGQHNIQGTDYFYTLQGWIKGVNSIGLTHTRQDPGRDGYTGYTEEEAQNPTFNRDEYAYALNYYEGDYEARGENHLLGKAFHANEIYSNFKNYEDKVGGVTYNRESLYNGNIAAMATSIRHFGELQSTQSMNYRYDQLHRIAAAHASKWEGIWTTVEGSYNTSYAYDGNGNIQNLYRNNLEATTIDELYYHYDPVKKNRLDVVKDGGTAEGLNNANPYEYKYDQIGNLTQNLEDGIEDIKWNIYGKVEKVTKTSDPFGIQATVEYRYDGTGNRIMKKVSAGTTSTITTYLRDASGNVMAIYEEKTDQTLAVKEIPIYGSSRLGQYRPKTDTKKTALGQRIYEFSNHLGNVLVTLTDNKVPQTDGTYESVVVSASDYYPFGMAMAERTYSNNEYRYGFNGKENDTDFGSHIQDYGFRLYSPAEARFLSVDPLTKGYPWYTPYQFAGNMPIIAIDIDGLEEGVVIDAPPTRTLIKTTVSKELSRQLAQQAVENAALNGGRQAVVVSAKQSLMSKLFWTPLRLVGNILGAFFFNIPTAGQGSTTHQQYGGNLEEDNVTYYLDENTMTWKVWGVEEPSDPFGQINKENTIKALNEGQINRFRELHRDRFTLSQDQQIEYNNLLSSMMKDHSEELSKLLNEQNYTIVKIEEISEGVMIFTTKDGDEEIDMIAHVSVEDGKLHLKEFHIDAGKSTPGRAKFWEIARTLGKLFGVEEVTIQGGKRTTGKYKGQYPSPISIKTN